MRASRAPRSAIAAVGAFSLVTGFVGTVAPATASGFDYKVTNYDHDGTHGVYLRNSSNINNVTRDSAHYLTYGTTVRLVCWAKGSSVGPYKNTMWDKVSVLNGSNKGRTGFLSEHWLNTPVKTNQHVPGEPECSTPPPRTGKHAQAAMAWATGQLGSKAWKNRCLSFVRNAYLHGSDDLKKQVSVPWTSDTYPQNIWGHFTHGRTGTGTPPAGALVFYLANTGKSKIYSHITIAVNGSRSTISTDDTYHSGVHRETIAQHTGAHPWNHYAGWWLPN